jgi:polyphosphate kinase
MTADPEITGDLVNLFNFLTGLAATQKFDHLLVAPFNMRERFNQLIERESEMARRGRPARIIAKFNSLEDRDITERLYAASRAGVKITLIVRGFCCLRPGVPGLSENIRVMSVVGRFLEHARIFHFAGGHSDPLDGDWLISSADWMYRNLSNRVEVALPVRDKEARARLYRIIQVHLADQRCAWDMSGDGTYERRSSAHVIEASAGVDGAVAREFGTFEALMQDAAGG